MKTVIYKYKVSMTQRLLSVVSSFKPLHANIQGDKVFLWGSADATDDPRHLDKTIGVWVLPTGAPVELAPGAKYLNTLHLEYGLLVFHVFVEE